MNNIDLCYILSSKNNLSPFLHFKMNKVIYKSFAGEPLQNSDKNKGFYNNIISSTKQDESRHTQNKKKNRRNNTTSN